MTESQSCSLQIRATSGLSGSLYLLFLVFSGSLDIIKGEGEGEDEGGETSGGAGVPVLAVLVLTIRK